MSKANAMTLFNPVALLKQMVAIPSLSGQENQLADAVMDWSQRHRLEAKRMGRNVVIRVGKANAPKRLLFNSHLDTVAPVSSWDTDPYAPKIIDGKVIGLGANDAKGCVTAMLCAVERLSKQQLGGELILALTVDEEIGTSGQGLEVLISQLGRLDAAVIGEPTNLDICLAQKGRLMLELQTSGVARHAAHAHRIEGANAIVEAAQAIMALDGWNPWPDHPVLGPITCQITTIQGGSAGNVIPDHCSISLDIRTVTGISTEEIASSIQNRTGAQTLVVNDRMKPFETHESEPIVKAALRSRPGSSPIASATMSDAVWTRHLPTIKVGPGQTERSHTAGEYITVDELMDGTAFYERLAMEFFG